MPPSVPPARSASDHLLLRVSELFHRVPAAQLVLHVCAGAREADGEPGSLAMLMGSNGLTKASLTFLNCPAQIMFKSTKVNLAPFFFHCSPVRWKI